MKIYIAADHAGYDLKEKLRAYLSELGYSVEDFGNFIYDEKDDYPDFMFSVAKKVAENPEHNRGILIGGSGQGEAMIANRFKGVRAAVVYHCDEDIVRLSREHNNANILSLGARFLNADEARHAVKLWLETPFSGEERHKRRIGKIDLISN
ncbi:MAG: RpiB/LacA/LacB family sugar-phosphate isomerase [Candidatus Terrybacteria bacterium]|nr:RpiB/LacA/LacB family sugar-phosphate isomerase [Candidatus Terrybacteria bacterium]